MTDEDLVQGMLEGRSLRTFMVPDPAMPRNYPEHMESYDLPHVVINGNSFWGKSESVHLNHVLGEEPSKLIAFCYTNAAEVFCLFTPEHGRGAFIRKDRYKTHEWKLIRNHKLVWDSGGDQPVEAVAGEIEACAKFRIAMLDEDGIWNVHPVDLPMYENDSGRFQLQTVGDSYPMLFRGGALPEHMIAKIQEIGRETAFILDSQVFECFYSVFSDGTYYNFYDIHWNTKQKYERLLVFSDKL